MHGTTPSFVSPQDIGLEHFPKEVLSLFRREREIAMIVYERGLATAKDVEAALGHCVRNAAVRSMLSRLVRKQILTQVKCGHNGTFVYGPGITPTSARETALRQFADDYFGGSLRALSDAIATMFITARENGAQIRTLNERSAGSSQLAARAMIATRGGGSSSKMSRAAHQRA